MVTEVLPIPAELIANFGVGGLLTLVVIMILTGKLIPVRTHRALESDRDLWRQVALTALGQTDALLPAARVTATITQALADQVQPPDAP